MTIVRNLSPATPIRCPAEYAVDPRSPIRRGKPHLWRDFLHRNLRSSRVWLKCAEARASDVTVSLSRGLGRAAGPFRSRANRSSEEFEKLVSSGCAISSDSFACEDPADYAVPVLTKRRVVSILPDITPRPAFDPKQTERGLRQRRADQLGRNITIAGESRHSG